MEKVSTIGLDIAKNVFQVHVVDDTGAVVIRRALRRSQVLGWFAKLPRCLIGIEACATAHYWGRELQKLGHEVRLIPPAYAKPMCGGTRTIRRPRSARRWADRLAGIDRQIVAAGREDATCRHLITAPGYGPILSSAMAAIVTDPGAFKRAGDFAASLGLVPRQEGTGGKVWLGPISKRGNGYLRRLLVNSLPSGLTRWRATALINSRRAKQDPWLAKLLATKPRKLGAVALANKLARVGWALMTRHEDYCNRPAAA